MDMITAFFWGIRGSEGEMIIHVATRGRDEKQRIKNGESENRRTRIKKINDNERPL